jgi:hypothetical protein
MAVTDWRAWTAQLGGSQPGQTSPFPFPGVGPIPDTVNGSTSIPTYPNVPVTVNAVDPFGGWTSQIPNSIRPTVPGLTS